MNKTFGILAATSMLALAAPASAVSFSTAGVTGAYVCDAIGGGPSGQIDVFAGASFNADFLDGDAGGSVCFSLNNFTGTAAAVTLASVTVNQNGTVWGFIDGVDLGGDVVADMFAQGVNSSGDYAFVIPANSSASFDFTYGQAYASGFSTPDLDFSVFATPVPLPAGALLLLGGLGALGVARRRKAAS